MEKLLILLSLIISLGYLALKVAESGIHNQLLTLRNRKQRLVGLQISHFQKPSNKRRLLRIAIGAILGLFTLRLWQDVGPIYILLFIALTAGILIEELSHKKNEDDLPALLGLSRKLSEFITTGKTFFESLVEAEPSLIEGPIKLQLKKTINHIKARSAPAETIESMRGKNTYLDQLASDVSRAGWENSPALAVTLELFAERIAKTWNKFSRKRAWQDSLQPYFVSGKAWVVTIVLSTLALTIYSFEYRSQILLTILVGTAATFLLMKHPGTRRTLATLTLALVLVGPALTAIPAKAQEIVENIPFVPVRISGMLIRPLSNADNNTSCTISTGLDSGWANLRAGPGMDFNVLTILSEGQHVPFIDEVASLEKGSWRQVIHQESRGWVFTTLCKTALESAGSEHLTLSPIESVPSIDSPTPTALVSNSQESTEYCQINTGQKEGWANLRSGPGMENSVAQVFPQDTVLQLLGEGGEYFTTGIWYLVATSQNTTGWIYNDICIRDK